jgi:hypothetical protein
MMSSIQMHFGDVCNDSNALWRQKQLALWLLLSNYEYRRRIHSRYSISLTVMLQLIIANVAEYADNPLRTPPDQTEEISRALTSTFNTSNSGRFDGT